jgi:hypothetical protein
MTSSFGSGENGITDPTNTFKYKFGALAGSTFAIPPNLSSIIVTLGTGGSGVGQETDGSPGNPTSIQYSLSSGSPVTLATANGGLGGQAGQLNIGGNGGAGFCGGGGGGGGSGGGGGGAAQSNPGYNGVNGSSDYGGPGGGFILDLPNPPYPPNPSGPYPYYTTGGSASSCGGESDSAGGGGGGGSGVQYVNPPSISILYPTNPPTTEYSIGGYGAQSTDSSGTWNAANGVAYTGAGGGGGSYRSGNYPSPGNGGSGYAILWFHN